MTATGPTSSSDKKPLSAAILQSCYIPWKGFFDIIGSVDVFVVYDDVQYVKRHWHNRNQIKTTDGPLWLTIPVETKGKYLQNIDETRIAGRWVEKHLRSIHQAYRRAPYYDEIAPWLERLYNVASKQERLSDVNMVFMEAFARRLGFETRFVWSSDLGGEGQKTDRLLALCKAAGVGVYLSGPSAKDYFESDKFDSAEIAYRWMDYSGYPEYPQLHPNFEHALSIIDLFMNTGDDALRYMKAPIELR